MVWWQRRHHAQEQITEHQIISAIKQAETGRPVQDVCRELSIARATFYRWQAKYGGMEASDLKRLKELEAENRKLKQMYAEAELHNRVLKEVIEKKL